MSLHLIWNNILKRNCVLRRSVTQLVQIHNKQGHVKIFNKMSVFELSKQIGKPSTKKVMNILQDYGYDISRGPKTVLDMEILELIMDELDIKYSRESIIDDETPSSKLPRPPVVTIMGHVDHGKTTLLDYLRKTRVTQMESGGITQSIGAFSVILPGDVGKITFVDTPGHMAFNAMRARGAQLTDIVILVVAADDGIMKQTIECIDHIRKAQVPFIIAINKIDKSSSNIEKVKKELLTKDIVLREYGGDIDCVCISALHGTNVDELLHLLNKFAKEKRLVADFDGNFEGVVLETKSNKQVGTTASVIVQHGSLRKGMFVLSGTAFAKVRNVLDINNKPVKIAHPSDPVQILGWRSLPVPGDAVYEVKNEAEAKSILKASRVESRESDNDDIEEISNAWDDSIHEVNTLNIVIKADVIGSLEALVDTISVFQSKDLKLNILHADIGNVNESDVNLAITSQGLIYCMNVTSSKDVLQKIKSLNIPIRQFDVIYTLLDDLKNEIEKKLPPIVKETVLGCAEVLQVFKMTGSRKGVAAGCSVSSGILSSTETDCIWRVSRNSEVLHEGSLKSLRKGSTDVPMVKNLEECGIMINGFQDYQPHDHIELIHIEKTKQVISWTK